MAETRVNDRQLDLSEVDQAVTLNNRLTVDTVAPEIYLRANTTPIDTDGLYRIRVDGSGYFIDRNTALAGDFSTFQEGLLFLGSLGTSLSLNSDGAVEMNTPDSQLSVSGDLLGFGLVGALLGGTSGVQFILRDESAAVDNGGLFRINIAPGSGQIDIEQNTAMDGDFSAVLSLLSINGNGLFPSGTLSISNGQASAGIQMEDSTEAAQSSNTLFRDTGDTRLHWKDASDIEHTLAYFDEVSRALFTSTADATVTNTTDEGTIVGAGVGSLTLPADFLREGRTIRVIVKALLSTDAAAPGNLDVRVKFGSTVILDRTITSATILNFDNELLEIDGTIVCRSVGETGTVAALGIVDVVSSTANEVFQMDNNIVTVDTTTPQTIDVTADWATADADNSITGVIVVIEALN